VIEITDVNDLSHRRHGRAICAGRGRGIRIRRRAYLGDPDCDVSDDTLYVAERFRLVELLEKP
jgi:hypothetical protein